MSSQIARVVACVDEHVRHCSRFVSNYLSARFHHDDDADRCLRVDHQSYECYYYAHSQLLVGVVTLSMLVFFLIVYCCCRRKFAQQL